MRTINDDLVVGPDDDDDDVDLPELLSAGPRPGPDHPVRCCPGDGPPGLPPVLRW